MQMSSINIHNFLISDVLISIKDLLNKNVILQNEGFFTTSHKFVSIRFMIFLGRVRLL